MDTSLPRATLINTEVRSFHSAIMGIDYQISTWYPPGYPKAGYQYPVIYLLGAKVYLGFVSTMIWFYTLVQLMPDCLIVGVGHDVSTYDEEFKTMEIDFLPGTYPNSPNPHRAADFLSFIKNELVPLIDTTYPVDPEDRCLAGYSWGAVFTLYALLHEPELFQKYLIGDAVTEDNLPHYLSDEQRLAEQRKSLPVHAFFSISEFNDNFVPTPKFIEALKRRNYEGLLLETLVVEGEGHVSAVWDAFSKGLRALYKQK